MNIFRSIRKFFPERNILPGKYDIKVVSLPDELTYPHHLPRELLYVLLKDKSYKVKISKLLERSGLGLRTIHKTPEVILDAVNEISVLTQHRTIITWIKDLLKYGKRPVFTMEDYEQAVKKNINLDRLVDIIYSRRFDFKQFIIIDESSKTHLGEVVHHDQTVEEFSLEYSIHSLNIQTCPKTLLPIIRDISILDSIGVNIKWISHFLNKGTIPDFSPTEHKSAEIHNIDLHELFQLIKIHDTELRNYLLIDKGKQKNYLYDLKLIAELNSQIEDVSIEFATQRIIFDNADTRTAVAQSIIKALLIIGPITHILEKYVEGVGKVFAATTDDLLSETAELFALRGSGFSWKILFNRSRILIPVFVLATYGAFEVEGILNNGYNVLAGLIFGFSAVALSFTTAVLSIRLYKHCIDDLIKEKKIEDVQGKYKWILALKQDFTNPARFGLFMGAIASPIVAMIVFSSFPQWLHNGWILALLGSTETIVAGITVMASRRINNYLYKRSIKNKIIVLQQQMQ